jgi:predicted Holliday junction resolvase-like endonuclease
MKKKEITLTIVIIIFITCFVFLLMWGIPMYNVWQKELKGKATLREAQWDRQVQIEEAQANLESEILNAQAEVERAKGMAKSIEIEQGKLTDRYIRYLWVRQNPFNDNTVIYIPTEANLPILEANRLLD